MIRYLKYEEIDKNKWDECIKKSFNGNLYGYSWYLDIVAEHWEALVQDDYERVFPLTQGQKYGISYLYQPFFTQQLGIYSKNILSREIVSRFLESIPGKFKYMEILMNSYNKIDEDKYDVSPQINHELDLIKSYDNIYKSYSKNLKRNIKKAEKAGLTLDRNVRPENVVEIFRKNRGSKIKHLGEKDYKRLQRMMYTCIYKGIAETYGAFTPHNELCAGAFFVNINRKVIFLFSGLTPGGREMCAMPYLINTYIKNNANSHLTFDFDGSNDPNLSRFYKSFGSKRTTYPKLVINNLPWIVDIPFKIRRAVK